MWHDCPVPFQPYHRAGQTRRWKAVLELVLALVFAFVFMAITLSVETRTAGVKKVKDLPTELRTFTTLANLAVLAPGALLAALACGRRAGSLWSVTSRIRWRWLATCLLAALVVRAIAPALVTFDLVSGRKDFVGVAEYLPKLAMLLVLELEGAEAVLDLDGTRILPSDAFLGGLERVFGAAVAELR